MTEVNLENITKLFREELKPLNSRLDSIELTLEKHTKILDTHTAALDRLLKEKKDREEEKQVSEHRFERLENWAAQVGEKLGIKLEL
ncbi:MAG: hypothetical protein M1383_01860 [Patescibacteria group bacterium]|nr:hypothetical protein [Patescibacteria group bacterium]